MRLCLAPQNLVDLRPFTFILTQEIHKATRLQYPVSILCLTPDRLRRETPPTFITRLGELSISQVRATDLATTLDSSAIALLLVDAEIWSLPGIVGRLKGGLEMIPGMTVSGGGGCYPQTATNGNELLQQAVDLMTRAKADGGNRLYLPS